MTGVGSRRLLVVIAMTATSSVAGGVAMAAIWHQNASRDRPATSPVRSAAPRYSIDIQAVWDGRGNPSLVANFTPNGGLAKPHWAVCPPADPSRCTPVKSTSQFLTAGPTPSGTVFQASAVYRGRMYLARSATWLGTVHAISLPSLTGRARYGSTVTPHPGRWSGGWQPVAGYRPSPGDDSGGRGPSTDALSVEACQTPAAGRCVNLTPQDEKAPYRARVGAAITGRYLFAFDQREPPDLAIAGVGYPNAAAVGALKAGPTVARSAALGAVKGPSRPTVSILRHAIRRGRRVLVARVHCSVRCMILLQVSGSTAASGRATVPAADTELVGVPAKTLLPGRFSVALYVGDGPQIKGTMRLR